VASTPPPSPAYAEGEFGRGGEKGGDTGALEAATDNVKKVGLTPFVFGGSQKKS